MKTREEILEKLRGLLAKTVDNGCTQEEAETAMAMAQTLMDRYSIEAADVAESGQGDSPAGGAMKFDVAWENPWLDNQVPWIGNVLEKAFSVKCMLRRNQPLSPSHKFAAKYGTGVRLEVFGDDVNRAGACWAAQYLHRVYQELWLKYKGAQKMGSAEREAFFMGVSRGIKAKLDRGRINDLSSKEKNSLQLYTANVQKSFETALATMGMRAGTSRTRRCKNAGAFAAGEAAGSNVNLNRPVGSGSPARVALPC